MDAAVAGLIGAAIGALTTLLGNLITSFVQAKQEERKWHRSMELQGYQNLQVAIAELTREMSLIVHEVMFITWIAKIEPERISSERIEAYDQEIYRLLPKFWSTLNYVAALDSDTYFQLLPLAQTITNLEDEVDGASRLYSKADSREESIKMLSDLFGCAVDVYDTIPNTFGNILSVDRMGRGIGKERSIVNAPRESIQKYPKD
jgi:hypothetical protein